MTTISSRQHPLVKQCRALHGSKGRREYGGFLVEGVNAVEAALQSGYPLSHALCSESALDWRARLEQHGAQVLLASDELLAYAGESQSAAQVLAIALLPSPKPLHEGELSGLTIVLDGVSDPGNVGTLLRAADAAGASRVWATRASADFYGPKCVRASAGSLFHFGSMPRGGWDVRELVQVLESARVPVVAAQAHDSTDAFGFDWSCDCALIVGHETRGISPELTSIASGVTIPVYGRAESLNAAMAGTLLAYAWRRAQR
jgi:TrmH family RNA methyltransferase